MLMALGYHLKAEDIQDCERCGLFPLGATDDHVDALHQPGKHAAVQGLGHSIPGQRKGKREKGKWDG